MELERVKGNTWVLKSWELIPLYQVDDTRCILLDTGTVDQRAELEAALDQAGLTPVAILGSHAHIDHMGSYGYFQKTRGAVLALTLGEAGQLFLPWVCSCSTTICPWGPLGSTQSWRVPPVCLTGSFCPRSGRSPCAG